MRVPAGSLNAAQAWHKLLAHQQDTASAEGVSARTEKETETETDISSEATRKRKADSLPEQTPVTDQGETPVSDPALPLPPIPYKGTFIHGQLLQGTSASIRSYLRFTAL